MVSRITVTLIPSDAVLFGPARENIFPFTPGGVPVFVRSMLEAECLVSNQAPAGAVFYPNGWFLS